ncbi:MAG: substrate-binding domain-containing protein [Oscillospiraceae bacterium]|nr:substrate-binding domain-containing protein [Oscillospiraceae bacterium]
MEKRPLIGIVTSVLAREYLRSIVRGAAAQARSCGCDVIVLSPLTGLTRPGRHAAAEQAVYELIASPEFDGFLYVKDDTSMGREAIGQIEAKLVRSNRYVMTVDEQEHPVFDSTQYDDYDDFGKVVRHLIEVHGYRRIYCLTGPADSYQARTRLRAYRDCMDEHGLYYDEGYYSCGTFWVDAAIAYARRLLSGELPMPEAVVCGNDVMAMALIKSLQGGGVRVPEEVAVAGYDGYPFAANVDLTLTTYARNHYKLGADAVRRLYRNMTGRLCKTVQRPGSGFRIGSSCGCTSVPAKKMRTASPDARPRMWEEDVFSDDLAIDLTLADSVPELLRRALGHGDTLYEAERLSVFLYEPDGQLRLAAGRTQDGVVRIGTGEPVTPLQVSRFLQHTATAETVFVSPLHLHERQWGLVTLSYGMHERIYDERYLYFVQALSVGLDRLLRTDPPAASPRSRSHSAMQEKLTALREMLRTSPEQPWTIERLCETSGISKSTLQKNYKALFGRSVFEELILFRVDMAKRLLSRTELSLSEISLRCGYSSESYFMKQFKKVTTMTPTEYRSSR